jgi:ribosomal protein L11 methyltransferase
MSWIGLHIQCEPEMQEILIAELSIFPFSTFQENETGISAWCEQEDWKPDGVKKVLDLYGVTDFRTEEVEKVNWNELWEKNYEPIIISDKCIVRATFHEPAPTYDYEIIITPKMSFGTGHHATTSLVLAYQMQLDHQGKKVLDVGCGTGILAIMAHKRGGRDILAIDIDDWCIENSTENFSLNACDTIRAVKMEIDKVDNRDYDILLANINRNVLLDQMESYAAHLTSGGTLVMSGFYEDDVRDILSEAEKHGFSKVESAVKNNWARLTCRKH